MAITQNTIATASDLNTILNEKAKVSHTHTKSQITDFPSSMPASDVYSWAKASSKPSYSYSEVGAAASSHTHDDRYYTESEMNTKLSAKVDTLTLGTYTNTGEIDNKGYINCLSSTNLILNPSSTLFLDRSSRLDLYSSSQFELSNASQGNFVIQKEFGFAVVGTPASGSLSIYNMVKTKLSIVILYLNTSTMGSYSNGANISTSAFTLAAGKTSSHTLGGSRVKLIFWTTA